MLSRLGHLYAPWREEYHKNKKNECVFCSASKELKDDENKIFYRDEFCFVIMNKYPYSPGHFMIIPHIHSDAIEDLEGKIWLRMATLTPQAVKMAKEILGARGVNVGLNLGIAAGAGIAEHLHLHIVPRWERDTNFITTIGQSRVYSANFQEIYEKLKDSAKRYFDLSVSE